MPAWRTRGTWTPQYAFFRRMATKFARSKIGMLLAIGALVLTSCGEPAESPVDSLVPPTSDSTELATTTSSAISWPQGLVGVFVSDQGVFLIADGVDAADLQLSDRPTGAAYLVGTDLVVAQEAGDSTFYPRRLDGPITIFNRSGSKPLPIANEALELLDAGVVNGRPVALVTSRTGDGMEGGDLRLLLVDLETDHRTDLGSVGGYESSVSQGRLGSGAVALLVSGEGLESLQVVSLGGSEEWALPPFPESQVAIAIRGEELTFLQARFVDPDFTPALTLTRFNLADGSTLGTTDLTLGFGDEVANEGGLCFTAEWWGESLLCDQTYGSPLLIDPSGAVTYFGQFGPGVVTAARADPGNAAISGASCPELEVERQSTDIAGPFFVCGTEQGFGGRVFSREGIDSAEEALLAWLHGPSPEERAAGYEGRDLTPYQEMTGSITINREGDILYMDIGEWETVGNMSTSHGSGVFFTSLFGTAFSDPTVKQFVLSVAGESCPLQILESTYCFPISWEDVAGPVQSVPTGQPSASGLSKAVDTFAVVLVGSGESLEVFDFQLGSSARASLPATATGIEATGPGDGAMQTVWLPIKLGDVSGTVNSRFLTSEVSDEIFANDPEPGAVLEDFAEVLRSRDRILDVRGYKGLTVIHFQSKHHWTINDEPTADDTLYEWSFEAGEPPWPRATFNDQIGAGFLAAWEDEDRTIHVDEPISGPEAAPPFIPTEFQNFHYLAVHDPGDQNLDWVTWYVFFDLEPGGWKIAGLSVDSYAP